MAKVNIDVVADEVKVRMAVADAQALDELLGALRNAEPVLDGLYRKLAGALEDAGVDRKVWRVVQSATGARASLTFEPRED